ncbi:FISUMP domain-containing protein [Aquimarina sp. AU119]|uniref:FISUMP domain-containing protein n=1 Tax=Aquimarina sp. AU119 TaxID=2108528 RepID=UPI000D686F1C|nr:FISUMP domain-containing protein [Aquimarina sp. AU119]
MKPILLILICVFNISIESCIYKPSTDISNNTFIDERDGKLYKTVKIGDQIWFAENFAYLPKIDTINISVYEYKGNSIEEAKLTMAYKTYGALYSWSYAKKLAPKGWRLPTDSDWLKLEKEIGLDKETINTIGWRGTNNEVNHLKKDGKSGFNISYGGWKTDYGKFNFQGEHANYWCADSFDDIRAYERLIGIKNNKIGREYGNKGCGFSVRYVKDDTK